MSDIIFKFILMILKCSNRKWYRRDTCACVLCMYAVCVCVVKWDRCQQAHGKRYSGNLINILGVFHINIASKTFASCNVKWRKCACAIVHALACHSNKRTKCHLQWLSWIYAFFPCCKQQQKETWREKYSFSFENFWCRQSKME